MSSFDNSCLYTTVKNVSGGTRSFGYLPPHGRTLAANAQVSFAGDLANRFYGASNQRGHRQMTAFVADLDAGRLAVISTPSILLHDLTRDRTRVVKLVNNVLVMNDPCWLSVVP